VSSQPASANIPLPLILLVEDSATTKALLSRYLGTHYQLLHARDGEEAWEALTGRTDIDLVITDIQMPRLTGQQLLVRIRKSDRPSLVNMPVIVMTTADDNADRNLAFLNGANDFINKPIDELELQARVNVHYRLARTIRELEANRQLLAEQATTDPLTRLKNRRAFFENGGKYMAHARRFVTDLSVIVADIDFFKKINDTYGHQVGDEALVQVARTLGHMTRGDDTVARLGGEEFAILLPDTNRLGAAVLAERIRLSIESEKLVVGDQIVTMTLSAGIASLRVDGGSGISDLVNHADRRRYLAKQNGRNRICVNDEGKSNFA
jgi:diguanylate cyclase (GGDEF)-like protein